MISESQTKIDALAKRARRSKTGSRRSSQAQATCRPTRSRPRALPGPEGLGRQAAIPHVHRKTPDASTDPQGEKVTDAQAGLDSATPSEERGANTASQQALASQKDYVASRPPAGIGTGGTSKSEYFEHDGLHRAASVELENQRGHNLKE